MALLRSAVRPRYAPVKAFILLSLIFASSVWADIERLTLEVWGPYCPICALHLEHELESRHGYEDVRFDLATTSFIFCKRCLGHLPLEEIDALFTRYNIPVGEISLVLRGVAHYTAEGNCLECGSERFEIATTPPLPDGKEVALEATLVEGLKSRRLHVSRLLSSDL